MIRAGEARQRVEKFSENSLEIPKILSGRVSRPSRSYGGSAKIMSKLFVHILIKNLPLLTCL